MGTTVSDDDDDHKYYSNKDNDMLPTMKHGCGNDDRL